MVKLPTPFRSTEYHKNVTEQYQALGRFVEAFEAMVDKARSNCIELLSRGKDHNLLVSVALHHAALTAKPLLEIMRAIIAEIVKDPNSPDHGDRDLYFQVLKQIASEYDKLASTRNNLLHGTWFVGYAGSEDPHASEFFVRKLTASKDGLDALELPKSAEELLKLADRCDRTANWISEIGVCLSIAGRVFNIRERFYELDVSKKFRSKILNPDA